MTSLPRHTLTHADGRALHVYGALNGSLDGGAPAVDEPPALHRRLDALSGAWIAVSPARNHRPQTGHSAHSAPSCPLCPGGPEVPFPYEAAVFDNRFPSLMPSPPPVPPGVAHHAPGLTAASVGRCEVVLYTSRHEGSLATLDDKELGRVIAVWRDRSRALWAQPNHAAVFIFENRGEAVGATLSHPHGQIYAFDHLPPGLEVRDRVLREHRAREGNCLSCAVVATDVGPERTVAANDSFTVAVPFAPRWPYEVHVRARRHGAGRLGDLEPGELGDLAAALREVVLRYDGLYGFELPYMMVACEAPSGAHDWHLSFEFLPPHRTRDKLKVRASVETAAGLFINDTIPEASAAELSAVPVASGSALRVPEVVAAEVSRP